MAFGACFDAFCLHLLTKARGGVHFFGKVGFQSLNCVRIGLIIIFAAVNQAEEDFSLFDGASFQQHITGFLAEFPFRLFYDRPHRSKPIFLFAVFLPRLDCLLQGADKPVLQIRMCHHECRNGATKHLLQIAVIYMRGFAVYFIAPPVIADPNIGYSTLLLIIAIQRTEHTLFRWH